MELRQELTPAPLPSGATTVAVFDDLRRTVIDAMLAAQKRELASAMDEIRRKVSEVLEDMHAAREHRGDETPDPDRVDSRATEAAQAFLSAATSAELAELGAAIPDLRRKVIDPMVATQRRDLASAMDKLRRMVGELRLRFSGSLAPRLRRVRPNSRSRERRATPTSRSTRGSPRDDDPPDDLLVLPRRRRCR
jgi:uncharacterized protein with von Willebrand factor type A (vWA) domain